jgi:hypothetical protein
MSAVLGLGEIASALRPARTRGTCRGMFGNQARRAHDHVEIRDKIAGLCDTCETSLPHSRSAAQPASYWSKSCSFDDWPAM